MSVATERALVAPGGGALAKSFGSHAAATGAKTRKSSRTAPTTSVVSMRVTPEERAALEVQAAGMSLAAYMRSRVIDEEAPARRTRGRFPVRDHAALAEVLGRLGRLNLAAEFTALAQAKETGAAPLDPETEAAVRQACADIAAMRADLVRALR